MGHGENDRNHRASIMKPDFDYFSTNLKAFLDPAYKKDALNGANCGPQEQCIFD